MPRIFALFCGVLMMGCSTAVFSSSYAQAGAGGDEATGGASAAGSSSGGSAGSQMSTAGATGHAGSPAGGETATGGSGGTAGAPAGLHVDVVPGVATDCVFPSAIDLPPLVPPDCMTITQNGLCMQCAGDCMMPFTFSDLSWDYASLTLSMTVTLSGNGTYSMTQGACGGTSNTCDYNVFFGTQGNTVTPHKIVFQKTDRGYVGFDSNGGPSWGSTSESCSTDTGFLNQMQCVRAGWSDYWYNVTIPCAK
jgi:hypothetical protein